MRATGLLIIIVLLTLITGALLAWPAHLALQPYTDIPFHKIVSRVTSLLGLVFIFIYLHLQGSLDQKTAGFAAPRNDRLRSLLKGWLTGTVIMLVPGVVFVFLDLHLWEPDLAQRLQNLPLILIKAAIAGLLVGLVEETLYRGALLGGLMKSLKIRTAIIFSSLLYAAVHYIKFRALPEGTDIHLFTGPGMLPGAFFRFADPGIIDSFLSLFAFGVLLALIRLREGNIYMCIGLHAGVVMIIKIINNLMDYAPGNSLAFLISPYDHVLGHLTTVWLCIIITVYLFFNPSTRSALLSRQS